MKKKVSMTLIVAVAPLLSLCLAQLALAGSLVGWGRNDYGECDAPTGSDFVAAAGGVSHSLALKADGSLAA